MSEWKGEIGNNLIWRILEIDIKVDEIEDLNAAIQERKNQKPGVNNRETMSAPVLPPPPQCLFSMLDGVPPAVTPRWNSMHNDDDRSLWIVKTIWSLSFDASHFLLQCYELLQKINL